jgi:hypothetical protein
VPDAITPDEIRARMERVLGRSVFGGEGAGET